MEAAAEAGKCKQWLTKKKRCCSLNPMNESLFCVHHNTEVDDQRISCSLDPSHSILERNLEKHLKKCSALTKPQSNNIELEPFYNKGINCGKKRRVMYETPVPDFDEIIRKIEDAYTTICASYEIRDSFKKPEACSIWMQEEVERKVSYQGKHVQHASIMGNLEEVRLSSEYAVVEFGAGRGYLSHGLAQCYGMRNIVMIERGCYKLEVDGRLKKEQNMIVERLKIDIEDLDLQAVECLKGVPYVAVGNHVCGSAIDLILRCCIESDNAGKLRGLAVATCCHHHCQYKDYINKQYLSGFGIGREEFDVMTSLTNWDVQIIHRMTADEKALLRLKCKAIIDIGRLMWAKQQPDFTADIVKYVPSKISRENNLLVVCRMRTWFAVLCEFLGKVCSFK
ncbi:hypothetical protein MKW92_011243 [Papaver armeniacum]|nr:hypothetical protein MKW92_011243 [Papaver armeniacum]